MDRRTMLSAVASLPAAMGKARGANDRIQVAIIGTGGIGSTAHVNTLLDLHGESSVVALCDVYQPNLERAAAAVKSPVRQVRDFRELLADKSIDAVVIATPDHWHALMTIEACKAGKDVYVEKPACVAVNEGQAMIAAARKYGRVVQVGTQQRSGPHYQKAAEMVRNGELGKVSFYRTWYNFNANRTGIGKNADGPPPPGLDWDLWLGPAPKVPYNASRFRYFRKFWDYAGSLMTDWGVHLLDIVRLALGEQMPRAVSAHGGKFWLDDDEETPDTLEAVFTFDGALVTFENRYTNAYSGFQANENTAFHGQRGTIALGRSSFRLIPEAQGQEGFTEQFEDWNRSAPGGGYATNSLRRRHMLNFFECMRTRQKPVADIEIGVRSTVTCLLGNAALRSGQLLHWDDKAFAVREKEAQAFLHRKYREPWKLSL